MFTKLLESKKPLRLAERSHFISPQILAMVNLIGDALISWEFPGSAGVAVEVRLIRRSSTEETRDGVTRSARTGPQSRALKARGQTTKASPVRCGDSRAFQLEVVARLRPHLGNCSAIRLPDLGACHRASQSRFERLTQIKPPALPGDTYSKQVAGPHRRIQIVPSSSHPRIFSSQFRLAQNRRGRYFSKRSSTFLQFGENLGKGRFIVPSPLNFISAFLSHHKALVRMI